MKKKLSILIAVFMLLLTYLVPAKLIEHMLVPPKNIYFSGLDGTVWSGSIQKLSVAQLSWSDVRFSINPLALFLAKLSVNISLPDGDVSGGFNLLANSEFENSLEIADANLSLNANLIENYLPINGVLLSGNISTEELNANVVERKIVLVDGKAHWRGAQVTFGGTEWKLGDFSVQMVTDEESKTISVAFLQSKNVLDIQGVATLSASGMFEFSGSVSEETERAIYDAVSMFKSGNVEAGRLPIKYRQRIF